VVNDDNTNNIEPCNTGDGISDIVEINAYLWALNNPDNAPEDSSLWVNPLVDDAYNDSDSDGLANIEGWERCYKFDYDNDDIPNFYDSDDDNDELPTSVELSVDLNPFNSADAHGDKDHDGLDNLWEYENGTMINDNDTDHDGIDDGAEFKYWQNYLYKLWGGWVNEETGAEVNETAVKYLKIPDVDKDNVTDGKEIKGWTVKIIVDYDEQNNPISKEVTLYGDPLAPYREPRKEDGELGDYIDSDEDNIPDIVESLLSNNSTFAKFARLFADPNSEYYDLWTSYNWTIAYFFSVRNNRNFHYYLDLLDANKYSAEQIARYITEWNNTPPHNKSCAENATQWLRDEFNPLITESMAPVITEFVVNTKTNGWIVWQTIPNYTAHVVVEIRDVSGISRVRIRSICPDVLGVMSWMKVLEYSGEDTTITADVIIDITEVSATVFYNITVNGTDSLDNAAEWNKTIYGPAGIAVHTIADILKTFREFLRIVGYKIGNAYEMLIRWIISILKNILYPVSESTGHSLYSYVNEKANRKPEVSNIAELKAKLNVNSIRTELELTTIFSKYIIALYEAGSFVAMYINIPSIMRIFFGVLSDSVNIMLSVFGFIPSYPIPPKNVVEKMVQFLTKNVDISSVDSYRRFFLSYAYNIIGSEIEIQRSLNDASEVKYALIIGEYDESIENSVKHDYYELEALLLQKGYTLIESSHGKNLQLTKNQIKQLFTQLGRELKSHPDAKVFIAFLGHGWTNGEDGGYTLYDGSIYLWSEMAYDFDLAVLDRNGDGQLSADEMNNPPYSSLVILFSTCFSRYAIDAFSLRDFPMKRVLIATADYNQQSYGWNYPLISFEFFMGHFTNKLQGDWGEEFLITFEQVGLGAFVTGWLTGVMLIGISKEIAELSLLKWFGSVVLGIIIGALIFSTACAAYVYITAGGTIYDAANWGAKWASYGVFFGLSQSSQAYIYNQQFAKEVVL